MAGIDALFFLGLYGLSLPFVIVLSEGYVLQHLGWKPNPFRTSLAMFLASLAVAFTLKYGGDYLAYTLLGRDAVKVIRPLYILTFISTFVIDGIIIMSVGRSHYESRVIWWMAIMTNMVGYLMVVVTAGFWLTVAILLRYT